MQGASACPGKPSSFREERLIARGCVGPVPGRVEFDKPAKDVLRRFGIGLFLYEDGVAGL